MRTVMPKTMHEGERSQLEREGTGEGSSRVENERGGACSRTSALPAGPPVEIAGKIWYLSIVPRNLFRAVCRTMSLSPFSTGQGGGGGVVGQGGGGPGHLSAPSRTRRFPVGSTASWAGVVGVFEMVGGIIGHALESVVFLGYELLIFHFQFLVISPS
jgi:hypothetical protein